MTLVDTSAWVALFRNDNKDIADLVEEALRAGHAALCGPVFTEISRGLREKERRAVMTRLTKCRFLPQPHALWPQAGDLGQLLRSNGVTAKTLDLLIAVYALRHRVPVLAVDNDFRNMRAAGVPLLLIDFA